MKKHISNPPSKKLSIKNPKIKRLLKKHATEAKNFSEKFVKARILDESILHRRVTI